MSDAKGGSLALYLKLDELNDNGDVIDSLGNGYDNSLIGDPQLIVDDAFGSCLRFDGDDDFVDTGLLFPEIQGTFTMAAWACPEGKLTSEDENNTGVQGSSQPYMVWPTHGDSAYKAGHAAAGISVGTNGVSVYEHGASYRPALLVWRGSVTGWTHIAVVYRENKPSLYINGELKKEGQQSIKTVHPSAGKGNAYDGQKGGIGGGHTGYFKGKVSHFRIYSEARSPEQIKQDMAADQTAIASFTKTHPLEFKLYEEDDKEPIIFIENGTRGESLTLELRNQSEREIRFPVLSDEINTDNQHYHFELLFRAGTLSQASLDQLAVAESDVWQMAEPVKRADGMVSLYFLKVGSEFFKDKATELLTLLHVNGAVAGGTRTTRVELKCPRIEIGPQDDPETLIDYFREQRLSIINYRGKKNIPLHVGFVGSNRILNDGISPNELTLRITNVLKPDPQQKNDILLIPRSTESADNLSQEEFNGVVGRGSPHNTALKHTSTEPTKLIISFDVDSDWAIAQKSQVDNFDIQGQVVKEFVGEIVIDSTHEPSKLRLSKPLARDFPKGASLEIRAIASDSGSHVYPAKTTDVAKEGQAIIDIGQSWQPAADISIGVDPPTFFVYYIRENEWHIDSPNSEETVPEWVLTHNSTEHQQSFLRAGEHIEFKVGNIISSLPMGQANLYLHYENIPGYWDGQFICTIEKSYLVLQGKKAGIGIVPTEATQIFEVKGALKATSLEGSGALVKDINASNITSGTIPDRLISEQNIAKTSYVDSKASEIKKELSDEITELRSQIDQLINQIQALQNMPKAYFTFSKPLPGGEDGPELPVDGFRFYESLDHRVELHIWRKGENAAVTTLDLGVALD